VSNARRLGAEKGRTLASHSFNQNLNRDSGFKHVFRNTGTKTSIWRPEHPHAFAATEFSFLGNKDHDPLKVGRMSDIEVCAFAFRTLHDQILGPRARVGLSVDRQPGPGESTTRQVLRAFELLAGPGEFSIERDSRG